MRAYILTLLAFLIAQNSVAQVLCPAVGVTDFTTPKLIFPTQPVVGEPWSICYKTPGRCRFLATSISDPLQINGSTIEIRKSYGIDSFALCPLPAYIQLNLPAPTQTGPLLVKYFWREGNPDSVLRNKPFALQEEKIIHVLATSAVQQLPALDLKAMAGLTLLLAAFGWGAIRRFG